MLPPLTHPERVASPSIRGYLFQTVGIARQWVELADDEMLLCEGDEDADRFILAGGVVQDVTQYQFKDVGGTVSVRDSAVQESVFNFLRAFHEQSLNGRRVRFVFTTSAARARQQTTPAAGASSHNVALAVDVLKAWQQLPHGNERDKAITALVEAVRKIVTAARPAPTVDGTSTKAHGDYAALEAATSYLDSDATRWTDFIERVDWRFDQGAARQQINELEQALTVDARTKSLPSAMLAERIVVKVLEASAENEKNLRVLTRASFADVVSTSSDDLSNWSALTKADRLGGWFDEIDRRLEVVEARTDAHGTHLAAHDRQLADHEHRLSETENAAHARVVALSVRDARYLSEFSKFSLAGASEVHVARAVVGPLADAALLGPLVVVGDPGAGKSGVLSSLATELKRRGNDVVVLSAESAHDLGDALVDVLESWGGNGPAVLVVDALDSLRDDTRAAALRKRLGDIIRTRGRWQVVASIRTFDLYQGTAIARFFAGSPPTSFSDARFSSVRHVAVGPLTDGELGQIALTAPEVFELATTAPARLATLLRNPFNLSLAGEVLMAGSRPEDFSGIHSQTDLLDLYWARRVGDVASTKDGREALVRELCDRMVQGRRLQAAKVGLDPQRLYELLTANVLREPERADAKQDDAVVAFSHHILFDFAVAKLWLPTEHEALTQLLVKDPELLIVARPSLEMFLHRRWQADASRKSFWNIVFLMCGDDRLRAIGKILGPTASIADASLWSDIVPLGEALQSSDPTTHTAADAALGYLVGALLPSPPGGRALVGEGAGPWVALCELASSLQRPAPIQAARRILFAATEHPRALTLQQMSAAGRAARALFAVASHPDANYRRLYPDAIRFVCRTFASDPAATADCVSSLLLPELLRGDGHVVVPALAREVSPLFADPDLAEAIYTAAFDTVEESRETTEYGGLVFGISSNRRQDYEGGLYSLKEAFGGFLSASVDHATRALLGILASFTEREHSPKSGEIIEGSFSAGSLNGVVRTDYSAIWDRSEHVHELEMLAKWEGHVASLAGHQANAATIERIFALCVVENRLALVWRRWLRLASRTAVASIIGPIIRPLLESPHVLTAVDTGHPAGEALREQFPRYSVDERARIEAAIVAAHALYQDTEAADRTCSRLFGCIDAALLTTSEAQAKALDLRNRGIEQPNRPPFSTTGWRKTKNEGDEADSQRWLRREGVPVNEEPNKRILETVRALETVHKTLADAANVEQLFDGAVRVLALVDESASTTHPRVVDCAWGEVAEALEKVVSIEACLAAAAIRARIWEIAAKVVECPNPRTTPATERQMDAFPSWGNPHARGTVGEVLVTLAQVEPTRPVLDAIERLAADDVASVRYRIVARIGSLTRVDPEMVWRIASYAVQEESRRSVLAVLAGWGIGALCALDANRGAKLLGCLLNRVGEGSGAKEVHRAAYSLLCDIHLDGDDSPVASALVYECTLRPAEGGADVLLHRVRTSLAAGPVEDGGTASRRQRRRAQNILSLIVEHAKAQLAELVSKHPGQMPEEAISRGHALVACLDKAAHEIYFASGAFDATHPQDEPEIRDPRITARFFDELAPTIEALAATGVPRVVHAVLQTLEHMLETNPRKALLMVAQAVEAAKPLGYQFDSLAAGLIVKVCTRFLAEHRALLQDDVAVRDALLDILDVFVAVGWPEAQAITYGLHDIFR